MTYVKYSWDENSNTLTSTTETLEGEYTLVENNTTTWSAGWYVVRGDVNIGYRVTVSGDVHLILTDYSSLNISGASCVTGDSNSLIIYGQKRWHWPPDRHRRRRG